MYSAVPDPLKAGKGQRKLAHYLALADRLTVAELHHGPAARFFNYFPPDAPGMNAHQLFRAWSRTDNVGRRPQAHFYLHLPFCRTDCRFCVYPHRQNCRLERRQFLEGLLSAIDYFSPALKGCRFSHFYLGGGTPTELSERELERLLHRLETSFHLPAAEARGFYTVPSSAGREKIHLLRRWGCGRANLGVISLTEDVLRRQHCAHGSKRQARKALALLQESGLRVNVQLLWCLLGQTPQNCLQDVGESLRWGPDEITVYWPAPGTPPHLIREDWLEGRRRQEMIRRLADQAGALGYRMAASPPAIKLMHSRALAGRSGFSPWPRRPAHLFSLGPGTQSRIAGSLRYRTSEKAFEPFDPQEPMALAVKVAADEDARRLCATLLFEGRMVTRQWLMKKAVPPGLRGALEQLCRLGLARRLADGFRLRELPLRLRFAAAAFPIGDRIVLSGMGGDMPRPPEVAPEKRWRRHLRFVRGLGDEAQRGPVQYFYVGERYKPLRLSPRDIAQVWSEAVGEAPETGVAPSNNFYLHVPFCRRRCRYCTYYSNVPGGRPDIESYLDRLQQEMAYFSRPLARAHFENLYLGGGTPSFLPRDVLRRLLDGLFSSFSFKKGGERCFEGNPDTITPALIALLGRFDFTRVSLGVQSFNPDVLARVNRRYQTGRMVEKAARQLLDAGLWVNLDLILGLPGESRRSFLRSVRMALRLRPQEVTLTPLFIDTPADLLGEAGGIGRWTPALLAALQLECRRAGYFLLATQFELKAVAGRQLPGAGQERLAGYGYRPFQPSNLFALGPSARSYIFGRLWYKCQLWEEGARFDAEAPVAEGRWLSLEAEQRCFAMSILLRTPPLREGDFRSVFGCSLEEAFGEDWRALQRLGLLRLESDGWRLGVRSKIRSFAAAMFLAGERAVYEAESWQKRRQTMMEAGPVVLPTQEPAPPQETAEEKERKERLERLEAVLEKLLPQALRLGLLPPGWQERLVRQEPFVILELGDGKGPPLRLGFAPAGSQESFFCRTAEFDIAYLTEGGRDPFSDHQCRLLAKTILERLGAELPEAPSGS